MAEDWRSVTARLPSRDDLEAENERLRKALYECAVLSGADADGRAPTWPPIEIWAVECVRELRKDYDDGAPLSEPHTGAGE